MATAQAFVDAVAWGEHTTVWALLAPDARLAVLEVATRRGMDPLLAARLRDGTATQAELDQFRGDLVNGFRADLLTVDVDTLDYDLVEGAMEPGTARVVLVVPVPDPILGAGLPTASLELSQEGEDWRVDRLISRQAK